jgi:hypothetical protein
MVSTICCNSLFSSGEIVMERIKKWAGMFIVALALAVLLTRLVGFGTEQAEAASTKTLMIGPSAFTAVYNIDPWYKGDGFFLNGSLLTAPINLDAGKKITGYTVYYYDNDATNLCVQVWLQRPLQDFDGDVLLPGTLGVCSSSAIDTLPRIMVATLPAPYKLLETDAPFVQVDFSDFNSNLYLRGVAIHYK